MARVGDAVANTEQTDTLNSDGDRNKFALDVLDHIYASAVDPDRLDKLIVLWTKRLGNNHNLANEFVDELSDHLSRASTVLSRSENHGTPSSPSAVEERWPLIGITPTGTVQHVNMAANKSFELSAGDHITTLPFTDESIEILLESVQASLCDRAEQIGRLVRQGGKRFELVSITPGQTNQPAARAAWIRFCNIAWSPSLPSLLSRTFDLTPAEIEVTRLVSEGLPVSEIASERQSTVSTVRTQLRTIYEKTDTRGQIELIRMMIGLATSRTLQQSDTTFHPKVTAPTTAVSPKTPYPRRPHEHTLTMPDGRLLSYSDFGPQDGHIVLHLHDYFSGDAWPAAMAEKAIARGLRVITPARGLYAKTAAYPENRHPFDQFAEDVAYLAENLKLDRIVLLQRAMGAKYAPVIADRIPNRVKGMVGVAPELHPFDSQEKEPESYLQQFFDQTCGYKNPILYEFMTRSLHAIYRHFGTKAFMHRIAKGVQPDVAVLNDKEHFEALEQGLRFTAANGHEAAYLDGKVKYNSGADWWVKSDLPYHVLVGARDTVPRADHARTLIERGADIDLTIIPDGGFLVFFSHQDLVLDALEAMAAS